MKFYKYIRSIVMNNKDTMVRKTITIFNEDYEFIKKYANSINKSVSEVMRVFTIKQIEEEQNQNLLDFLNNNCTFVSQEEQADFDKMNIDFDDISGTEVKFS
ncbi:hypothetical protein HMPREF0379_0232 [[Eubacterium] yurii subsp. margaretiae ATCC 43715]|nr:hypothetical protein HMPREF0379_0232 [[Eubacterium] yurii subsp. margaretiae ATCC 43715]